MKGKLFLFLLLAITVLSCSVLFVGCNDTQVKHEHTFEKEWTMDKTYHYHKSTCEHTSEVSEKGEHEFNGGNVCTVCGFGIVKYRIFYKLELDGAVNKSNPYEYKTGDDITLNPASCVGYEFTGWVDANGQKIEKIPADSVGDLTFTATWSYTGVYTIEYVLRGGTNSPDNPTTFRDDQRVILQNATKENYEFICWSRSEGTIESFNSVPVGTKENIVLYAFWGYVGNYGITYELDGGTNSPNNPEVYSARYMLYLSNPTKDGYKFLGWKDGNGDMISHIPSLNANDVTLYAVWAQIYSVSYELDGGTNNEKNITSYTAQDKDFVLLPAFKPGYKFIGWVDADNKTLVEKISASAKKNYELYAVWGQAQTYRISYVLDGGTNSPDNPEIGQVSEPLLLSAPTKDGYKFTGWVDANGHVIDSIPQYNTNDVTLYAKWAQLFSVSYELDGGMNNERNIKFYTVQNKDFVLLPAVKAGYKFIGWVDADNKTLVEKISVSAKKNYVLYAVWGEADNSYPIMYTMVGTHSDASGNVTTLSLNSTSSSYLTNIAFGEQFNNLMMVECSLLGQTATLSEYYLSNWYFLDKDGNKHYVYRNSKSFVPPVFDDVAKDACVDGILTLYPTIGCNWFGPY